MNKMSNMMIPKLLLIVILLIFPFLYFELYSWDKKYKIYSLDGFNTEDHEYAPALSQDGKRLYFVSNRPGSLWNFETREISHDIWVAQKNGIGDTIFTSINNLDTMAVFGRNSINSAYNEGSISFSPEGDIAFLTCCNQPNGIGRCDIYYIQINGNVWSVPFPLGYDINTEEWESLACMSPWNRRLYFISDRPGPNGSRNHDIWFSDFSLDSNWYLPSQNLSELNTSGREATPYIFDDETTLIFASDTHTPNYGGLDLYVSHYNSETGKWSAPENLGEGINTNADELGFAISFDGSVIYFASNRKKITGGKDDDYDIFMGILEK